MLVWKLDYVTVLERKKGMYSAATVTRTPCVLAMKRTSYRNVQVTVHTKLRRLYVGIQTCGRPNRRTSYHNVRVS